ncbi:MAG: hypothetical protein MJY72_06340 [Bacteroidales bacterium]|nr:hypothetical protein [Bacteroidales bacterium]
MRRLFIIMVAAIAAISAASCTEKALLEEFTNEKSEIGLTIKGQDIFTYDENSCQLGYDESLRQFRVSDDMMTDYYILTVDNVPEIGYETQASLIYTTDDDVISQRGLSFKLVKVGRDGTMWFWNKKNTIGAVVRKL